MTTGKGQPARTVHKGKNARLPLERHIESGDAAGQRNADDEKDVQPVNVQRPIPCCHARLGDVRLLLLVACCHRDGRVPVKGRTTTRDVRVESATETG